MTKPFPPHKVIGNVYFVGTVNLGTYLISTPDGHILINTDYEATVPTIRAGVEKLGFKFSDIKIILEATHTAITWRVTPWSRNSPVPA